MVLLLCAGCRSTPEASSLARFEFSEPHMGTLFSITLYAPDEFKARAGVQVAFQRIADLDRIMTDYDPASELMQLSRHPAGEPIRVSKDLFDALTRSQEASEQTGGAFDVTVGPYVRAWRAARKSKTQPTPNEIATMGEAVGYEKLRLDARSQTVTLLAPRMQLDLGGIGKGIAADQALAVLRSKGIRSALVAASGDIAIGDAPPGQKGWKVGVAKMDGAPDELEGTLLLHNAGVSTSGDSEQHVEINGVRYSHIVNPLTGLGLTERIQVTIIAPNATVTDGLDTGLSIMGLKRGLALVDSHPEMAAIMMTRDEAGDHVYRSRQYKRRFGGR